ncbi:MAG TPA: hypothetical protein PK018_18260 [Candidatus Competibacter sp.]|mgnify:CR=1 FL=1|nr:hypothetical protein [Candidatus Competibacteraceae bacterium]HPE74088.1 hypothetical protein [Candidatus Competibacter sp.]
MHANEETTRCEDDTLEPFYRLDDDGRLSWTEEGLQTYRKRFARFGIRIEAIQTFEDYRTAMRLSASVFVEDTLEQLAERAKGKPWRELLEAVFIGDAETIKRAQRRYTVRQMLRIVSRSTE